MYSKKRTISYTASSRFLLIALLVWNKNPLLCQSFMIRSNIPLQSPPSTSKQKIITTERTPTSLFSSSYHAVYDGSEWKSIQEFLQGENVTKSNPSSSSGTMEVIVGTKDNKKVVGIRASDYNMYSDNAVVVALDDNNNHIYRDSMAKIPRAISDRDAAATLIASLPSVHCSLPRIDGVGGVEPEGRSTMTVSGRVVIIGGNEYACFAAEGLASLGSSVSLITTSSPNIKNKRKVDILPPAVPVDSNDEDEDDEEEQGFCDAIGQFDTLLDTVGDERPQRNTRVLYQREDTGSITSLLRNQHNCTRYVSTVTEAQSIVLSSGILFGPGKADKYVKEIQSNNNYNNKQQQEIIPPKYFGTTVQRLLENGIIYRGYKKDSTIIRGWSLSEFWERSTWPVDSETGNRFGFPVKNKGLTDDERFALLKEKLASGDNFDEEENDDEEEQEEDDQLVQKKKARRQGGQRRSAGNDPFVKNVYGVEGLLDNVVNPETDSVVFLSASWCRTCKSISPAFSRIARQTATRSNNNNNDSNHEISFVKADTTGILGRQLGKYLQVDAVPAFVLYRKGKRYGKVLSLNKLPSEKLDVAMDLLESGKDWDSDAILEAEA